MMSVSITGTAFNGLTDSWREHEHTEKPREPAREANIYPHTQIETHHSAVRLDIL